MSQYIALKEYANEPMVVTYETEEQAVNVYNQVTEASDEWKKRLGLKEVPIECRLSRKSIKLLAKGVTGFISSGDLKIEIRPKFLADTNTDKEWKVALVKILFLINKGFYLDKVMTSADTDTNTFVDLMAMHFMKSIDKGYIWGFVKDYKEENELRSVFKGRYDYKNIVKHICNPNKIPCKYDEFSYDNNINKILVWGARVLKRSVANDNLRTRLNMFINHFPISSMQPTEKMITTIKLPRQYHYLDDALNICKILAKNDNLSHQDGDEKLMGFLWKTETMFEQIVRLIAKEYCRKNKVLYEDSPQPLMNLVNAKEGVRQARRVHTTPDIRIIQNKKTCFVLDAKYKTWKKHPKTADCYQVIAGADIVDCKYVGLIYPATETYCNMQLYKLEGVGTARYLAAIFVDISKIYGENGIQVLVEDLKNDLDILKAQI